MLSRSRALALSCLIATAVAAPIVLAFRDGSDPGEAGGPLEGGSNCTECHGYNPGPGSVALTGIGPRYIPGAVYDITLHVTDPNELGAGFEISAQTTTAHVGTLIQSDVTNTRPSGLGGSDPNYLTHTLAGLLDSVNNWATNGNAADFHLQWQAPSSNVGGIVLFGAGIAMNNDEEQTDDIYYSTYAALQAAEPFDADGDRDGDLRDAATFQRCFGTTVTDSLDPCAFVDDGDGVVALDDWSGFEALFDGPTTTVPAAYVLADYVRGGLLYDRWWSINGADAPTGNHPLYPETGGKSGRATFRCKECHGWDYKGVAGAYGSGPHFTGITGIFGTTKTPREIFDLLKADPVETPNGHNMNAYGMTDADIWDVVKFSLEGVVDTDDFIDETNSFVGFDLFGSFLYASACASCHGELGTDIPFGPESDPYFLGDAARGNPWEMLHKMRFGQPGEPMRGAELLGWSDEVLANVGAFAQTTLP